MEYTIAVSQPGYMAEVAYDVDSLEEARAALVDEITRTVDALDGPDPEAMQIGAEEAEKHQEVGDIDERGGSVKVGCWVHEIIPSD